MQVPQRNSDPEPVGCSINTKACSIVIYSIPTLPIQYSLTWSNMLLLDNKTGTLATFNFLKTIQVSPETTRIYHICQKICVKHQHCHASPMPRLYQKHNLKTTRKTICHNCLKDAHYWQNFSKQTSLLSSESRSPVMLLIRGAYSSED